MGKWANGQMDFETVVDVVAIYFFEVRLSLGIVHSRGFGFGVLLKVSFKYKFVGGK